MFLERCRFCERCNYNASVQIFFTFEPVVPPYLGAMSLAVKGMFLCLGNSRSKNTSRPYKFMCIVFNAKRRK